MSGRLEADLPSAGTGMGELTAWARGLPIQRRRAVARS